MATKSGDYMIDKYLDDQQLYQLYEKFVLEYFKKEYTKFSPSASYIDWNTDDNVLDFLLLMKSLGRYRIT